LKYRLKNSIFKGKQEIKFELNSAITKKYLVLFLRIDRKTEYSTPNSKNRA